MTAHLITFAGACLLLVSAAHAGRPLATEDADVLERGECEWESFAARSTSRGSPAVNGWATQVGCGIGFRSQAALGWGRTSLAGGHAQAASLSGKTTLLPREGDAPGLTLAWGLSGERLPGGSFEHEGSALTLVASTALADGLAGHANLGWSRSRSARQSSTTWNVAAEAALAGGIDAMAEFYGDDRGRPWWGTGLRWAASEHTSVDASFAVQRATPRVKLFTLGFKLAF